jgi:hypothetical protein
MDADMKISVHSNQYNLPDFMIVGAARSATTTLFYHLDQHPDISMSLVKEPNFFSFYSDRPNYTQINKNKVELFSYHQYSYSLPHYSNLYKPINDSQLLGEASTSYLCLHDNTIANIGTIYGQLSRKVKIIIILRNPIDRAWSHYMFHVRNGREHLSFLDAISHQCITSRMDQGISYNWDYLEFGYYYKQVKAYKNAFDNVFIILMEDFLKDPIRTLTSLMQFIEVSPRMPGTLSGIYNVSGKPKNRLSAFIAQIIYHQNPLGIVIKRTLPPRLITKLKYYRYRASNILIDNETISQKQRLYLASYYQDDINNLSRLLNRNLDHWLS